ncbi:hypothetical protein EV359DRAFT_43527 [Lentinula novae-zelandiae]|nr:hypothetical protein EV359DRAFT_43527 [Lentinula novae-zelandiae]
MFEFKLKNIIWNDRVMAVVVGDLEVLPGSDAEQKGAEFIGKLSEQIRTRLHITVGTKNHNIQPVEAKALVEEWRQGTGGLQTMEFSEDVLVQGRIKGLTW